MKFHLDENVDHAIAHGLRRHGLDVTVPVEVGLIAADDMDHIAFALLHGRVVITQDRDYLVLDSQGVAHAGIAYWRVGTRSIGQVILSLVTLSQTLSDDDIAGKVKFV